jgi:serine/threonine-protein kinase
MNEIFKLAPYEWALLRALLDEALALPAAERGRWLRDLDDQRTAGLKPRLQGLLEAAAAEGESPGTAARLLETLPKVETGQFAPMPGAGTAAAAEKPGDSVGPYRLIRELGSGGMGSVWLAERTDMLHGRQVALKLPHGAWKRAGLAERMAREREILATLEHPNIARLYDAGVTPEGQPWLALEYVEGERIDAHCRRLALPVRERVQLALQVVRAVAHAHGRLVVHRDLKPGNVLVTEQAGVGQVKLLDFGIAKLMEQGRTEATELTQAVGGAFTPEYASPEQVLGEPLTTTSDVYSLGVVLFELLADVRPYRLASRSRAALEEAISQGALERPSALAPAERRRALRGDLDTIVLKALQREPTRRYATADALADDLQRYLDQLPVLAQPDRAWYRLTRFVVRNRLAVGVALGVGVAVLGASGAALWQAGLARAEQQRAAQALGFLTSVFREADPNVGPGQRPSAADLLKHARERVDVQFADQPLMRVELLNTLAESLVGVQEVPAADETSARALREAESLLGPRHPQALRARAARVRVQSARYDLKAKRGELEPLLRLLGPDPRPHPRLWLQAQVDWAEQHVGERKLVEAERIARDALAQADRLPDPWHEERAALWQAIASASEYRTQFGPATEAAQQAVLHAELAWHGRERHPQVTNTRYVLGRLLGASNRHEEAVAMLERTVADAQANWGPQSRLYGQYVQALGITHSRAGQLAAARERARTALAVIEQNYGADAAHTAAAVDALAFVHYLAREPQAGIALYDRATAIVARTLGPSAEPVFPQRIRRAALRAWGGELDVALAELRSLVEEYGRVGQASLTASLMHLGMVERLAGRPAVALELQGRALAAVREGPTADRERIQPRLERGAALHALGRHDEAEQELAEALRQAEALRLARTPLRCDGEIALGRVQLALGRAGQAVQTLRPCDDYWQTLDAASPWAGEAAYWHGRALVSAGQAEGGRRAMARAKAPLWRSNLPVHAALSGQR